MQEKTTGKTKSVAVAKRSCSDSNLAQSDGFFAIKEAPSGAGKMHAPVSSATFFLLFNE